MKKTIILLLITYSSFGQKLTLENWTKENSVGHAFINITQGQNTLSYGFYPEKGLGVINAAPGIMGRNQNYPYHVSITNTVSSSTLEKLIKLSFNYDISQYELKGQNCTNFAISAAITIGLSIDRDKCLGNYGEGEAYTPG